MQIQLLKFPVVPTHVGDVANYMLYCTAPTHITCAYVHSWSILKLYAHTQVLQRCFRVTIERARAASTLMDCKGCQLRVEPMVSVRELEKHLLTLVCGGVVRVGREGCRYICGC